MSSEYRAIGDEILKKLDFDPTRLGEALLTLNDMVRSCLGSDAWDEVFTHCGSAYELCDAMHGSAELREWGNVLVPTHAEGIFYAYQGISHLCQAEEAKEKKDFSDEHKELDKAIHCLEKSQQAFHFEFRDQWNEVVICLGLWKLYKSQNKLNEALLAFQRILGFLDPTWLSIERRQEIAKIVSVEIEETRRLFGDQKPFALHELEKLSPPIQQKVIPFRLPIIDEIAAGKEKPAWDDISGYMWQTDEFEFEFEGQVLKAELLKGSQLTLHPEYDYVAMQVSGDSMDQARIASNDYIILQKPKLVGLRPNPKDIVAVVFRDEADNRATLKRFGFDRLSGNVTLKPASSNPAHKTRVLRPEAFAGDNPSVEVVGIAIAVLKP